MVGFACGSLLTPSLFHFKGVSTEPLFFSQRLEVRILAVTDGQRTIETSTTS
nr:MAG TPA: hypothetical protein [Caudoviricetes sp.]